MSNGEIALQLTLKAVESDKVFFRHYTGNDVKMIEEINAFNVKQVLDFYRSLRKNID